MLLDSTILWFVCNGAVILIETIPLQIIRALALIIYSCFSFLSQTTHLKTITNDLRKFHIPSQSDKTATMTPGMPVHKNDFHGN